MVVGVGSLGADSSRLLWGVGKVMTVSREHRSPRISPGFGQHQGS